MRNTIGILILIGPTFFFFFPFYFCFFFYFFSSDYILPVKLKELHCLEFDCPSTHSLILSLTLPPNTLEFAHTHTTKLLQLSVGLTVRNEHEIREEKLKSRSFILSFEGLKYKRVGLNSQKRLMVFYI